MGSVSSTCRMGLRFCFGMLFARKRSACCSTKFKLSSRYEQIYFSSSGIVILECQVCVCLFVLVHGVCLSVGPVGV